MDDPFVTNFLNNYKSKSLANELEPYLKCKKLQNYILLTQSNKTNLIHQQTYIKFIKIEESFKDKLYSTHIRSGGILLNGGMMHNDKFKKLDDKNKWTHLLLKYDPAPKVNNKGKVIQARIEPHIYVISLKKCYVFYKIYNTKRNNMLDLLEVILVKDK